MILLPAPRRYSRKAAKHKRKPEKAKGCLRGKTGRQPLRRFVETLARSQAYTKYYFDIILLFSSNYIISHKADFVNSQFVRRRGVCANPHFIDPYCFFPIDFFARWCYN
jgi:hypothetical protein